MCLSLLQQEKQGKIKELPVHRNVGGFNIKKINKMKLLSGLGCGLGVGTCFSVAMDNLYLGLLFGLGIGLCYAIAFGAFKGE